MKAFLKQGKADFNELEVVCAVQVIHSTFDQATS